MTRTGALASRVREQPVRDMGLTRDLRVLVTGADRIETPGRATSVAGGARSRPVAVRLESFLQRRCLARSRAVL